MSSFFQLQLQLRIRPILPICCFLTLTGTACRRPLPERSDAPPPLTWLRGTVHDFGPLPTDTTATVHFPYRNTGDQALRIETIRTDCGCTVPAWPLTPLAPGHTDSIRVEFDATRPGGFEKHLRIFFYGLSRPYRLTVAGQVGPD